MRVAYLISEYPKVSHTFIRREILELERLGVDVLRVAIRPAGEELPDPADAEERLRTRCILGRPWPAVGATIVRAWLSFRGNAVRALMQAVSLGRRAEKGVVFHLFYWLEACVLASWMRSEAVTHVHAHFGSNPATVAMLAARILGGTFSFTAHGTVETDNPAGICISEKIRRAAFVVAVSDYGRAQLMRWVAIEHWQKIHVVRCGLGGDYLDRPPPRIVQAPRFIAVGRLSAEKGHLVLVHAVAELAKSGRQCEVVVVGDGPLRDSIASLIGELGIADRLRLAGWKSGPEVRQLIGESRALVLPSFAEGLPVVVMEAMALGRPVVATWVAGIPELVSAGETGWLVPPGDPSSLALAMAQCLDCDGQELDRRSANALRVVRRRHDGRTETQKLLRLFASIARDAMSGVR